MSARNGSWRVSVLPLEEGGGGCVLIGLSPAQRAHAFKGALANLGLKELSETSRAVETIAGALAHKMETLPDPAINLNEV